MTTVRIGLTGPIGCGKSTVAGWLAGAGAVVVDADEIARRVTDRDGPAFDAVVARFGPQVVAVDGSLDRAALARIVFADPSALDALERIVHPAVRPRIVAAIDDAARQEAPAIVVEAIKLVEGGLAEMCDEVWLVTCGPDAQRDRLTARGMDPDDAERRIAAQGDMATRLGPHATRIIAVDGSAVDARSAALAALDSAVEAEAAR